MLVNFISIIVGLMIPTFIFSFLQRWMSKRESKIVGWVMPGIHFIMYIFMVVPIVAISTSMTKNPGFPIIEIIVYGIAWNITTCIYLIIYRNCRKGMKENEINKMMIQDL